MRVNASVLPEYILLVLSTSRVRRYYRDSAKGLSGSMPKINQGTVSKTLIPQLSPDEQRKLVSEVSASQAGISRMTAAASSSVSRAEQLRRALFEAAFSGRLVHQDPSDEPASAILQRIQASRSALDGPGRARQGTASS